MPFMFLLVFSPTPSTRISYSTRWHASTSTFPGTQLRLGNRTSTRLQPYDIRGFLNFDEALQYARQLYQYEKMANMLRRCRSLVISEHNLTLIGTRYSYKDYDEFYERTFLPLQISNEELLNIPTDFNQTDPEDTESEREEEQATYNTDDDFDLW